MIRHVTDFLQHGHQDLAYKFSGQYLLGNIRAALVVGLAVEKSFAPKPTDSKPTITAPESTTETPKELTTEAEAGSTTEVLEELTTEGEAGSTTGVPVEVKRVLRHQNRRVHEM